MSAHSIRKAIIFAAGRGERMRHLTASMPKPMVPFMGVSLIKRLVAACAEAGIEDVMINLHYQADKLREHLADISWPRLHFSYEETLLDTGGGTQNIIDFFGDEPFLAMNGDMAWFDMKSNLLPQLCQAWDQDKMNCLLLLYPTADVSGFEGHGDYHMHNPPYIMRERYKGAAPYVFAGARICKPNVFDAFQDKKIFSFLEIFDFCEAQKTLCGVVYDGVWFHISTPEMLAASEETWQKLDQESPRILNVGS